MRFGIVKKKGVSYDMKSANRDVESYGLSNAMYGMRDVMWNRNIGVSCHMTWKNATWNRIYYMINVV